MAMNRILEFTPSPEEAVVSRILVLVHQAVDEHFPAVAASRQFTKTVFSGDGERTAIGHAPDSGTAPSFAGEEDTASDNKSAALPELPPEALAPPPPPPPPRPQIVPPPPPRGQSSTPQSLPPSKRPLALGQSRQGTHLDEAMAGLEGQGPDWWTRILVALLIAGAIVFAYSVLF